MADNPPPEEKNLDSPKRVIASKRRKRTVFTREQIRIMTEYYERNRYPGIKEREELAAKLNTDESRIHVWFQNRRAREQQKRALRAKKQMVEENPSSSETEEESELSPSVRSRSPSWPREPGQEAGPRTSFPTGRRSAIATTEPAHYWGFGISQSHHFDSSQTTTLSTPPQPCVFSRPISQGNSSQCGSFWVQQGTKGPENYGPHTSFHGGMKLPPHYQEQSRAMRQLYSNCQPLPFQCTQQLLPQLQTPQPQQPPALLPSVPQPTASQVQQLTPSLHQFPQEHQSQIHRWLKEGEQPCELLPSFNQKGQLQPSTLSKVGLGSTMVFSSGEDVSATLGDLTSPQEHLDAPLKDFTTSQGHLSTHLGNLTSQSGQLGTQQENLTAQQGNLTIRQSHLPAHQGYLGEHLGDVTVQQGHLAASQAYPDIPLEDVVEVLGDLTRDTTSENAQVNCLDGFTGCLKK